MHGAHADHAPVEAMGADLSLMPVDKTGSIVTRPIRPPMLSAASMLASPSPTTGMSTAPRISSRPGSWKWPMTKAS